MELYKNIVVPVDLAHAEKADTTIDVANALMDGDARIVLTNDIEEMPSHIVAVNAASN